MEITITAEDARAFQSILNEVALRGAEAVQEKLSNSGQSVIDQLIALHNQDPSYAERKALMCAANKTYFSPTEVAQAFTQLRAIFSRDAMQQYQSWLSANLAHASDMRLWVWEKRSNDQAPAALTNADYYAQDPVMLETWRQDGCNNASLAEMSFFDAEDNAVELME